MYFSVVKEVLERKKGTIYTISVNTQSSHHPPLGTTRTTSFLSPCRHHHYHHMTSPHPLCQLLEQKHDYLVIFSQEPDDSNRVVMSRTPSSVPQFLSPVPYFFISATILISATVLSIISAIISSVPQSLSSEP